METVIGCEQCIDRSLIDRALLEPCRTTSELLVEFGLRRVSHNRKQMKR